LRCGATPYAAEVAVYDLTTTYSLDWRNPPVGWYYFIFSSETAMNPIILTPFVLVATFNEVQTSMVLNTVTSQISGTATQTITSIQVTEASTGIMSGLNTEIVRVIVIVEEECNYQEERVHSSVSSAVRVIGLFGVSGILDQ
jgi:hypothetical protein